MKTLAGDPAARVQALAVACAATVVIAIIRDAWSLRSQVSNRTPARITPPRAKDGNWSQR